MFSYPSSGVSSILVWSFAPLLMVLMVLSSQIVLLYDCALATRGHPSSHPVLSCLLDVSFFDDVCFDWVFVHFLGLVEHIWRYNLLCLLTRLTSPFGLSNRLLGPSNTLRLLLDIIWQLLSKNLRRLIIFFDLLLLILMIILLLSLLLLLLLLILLNLVSMYTDSSYISCY